MADAFSFPPFRVDVANERLWRESVVLQIRPKTFAALVYLLQSPQRLVTHEELLRHVWGHSHVSESLLRGYVRELRQVLGDDAASPAFIETVPRRGYRFIAPVTAEDAHGAGTPAHEPSTATCHLVGRDQEMATLQACLVRTAQGLRQVVFIAGEPGIGKTAVLGAFLDACRRRDGAIIAVGQCIELYGEGEPYLPLLQALNALCRSACRDRIVELLTQYAPAWMAQLGGPLTELQRAAVQQRVAGATQARMLRELVTMLEVLSEDQLLVVALEDLQWSDYSTVDLISLLSRGRSRAHLLLLGTYRQTEILASAHPLRNVVQALGTQAHCTVIKPQGLTGPDVVRLLDQRFPGTAVAPMLTAGLLRNTDGNPLFIGAVLNDLVAQERLRDVDGRWTLTVAAEDVGSHIPESLHDLIDTEMDRLDPAQQELLAAASVAGVEFDTATLAGALVTNEMEVAAQCDRLVHQQRFLRRADAATQSTRAPPSRYAFVHGLYQQVGLERSAPAQRALWHQRIAASIETQCAGHLDDAAAELAIHLECTGAHARAAHYYAMAAERAALRFAHREAVRQFRRSLDMLAQMPASPGRDALELRIQIGIGPSLVAMSGIASPAFEAAYARALLLIRELDQPAHLGQVLHGLAVAALARCRFAQAEAYASELATMAHAGHDAAVLADALWPIGLSHVYRGELATGLQRLDEIDAIRAAPGPVRTPHLTAHDAVVVGRGAGAWALWMLGHPDLALERARASLDAAQAGGVPFVHANALNWLAITHVLRHEPGPAAVAAAAQLEISTAQEFAFWQAEAKVVQAWAAAMEAGDGGDGGAVDALEQAARARLALAPIGSTRVLGLYAEACLATRQSERGLAVVEQGLAVASAGEERFWLPELHRLHGALLAQGVARDTATAAAVDAQLDAARHAYLAAAEAARAMRAVSWELRAAIGLTQTHATADVPDARDLHRLTDCLGRFAEGRTTPDQVAALSLLAGRAGVHDT